MEFEKLLENVKKELKEISEQGLTANNLATVGQLVDIYKDLKESENGEFNGRFPKIYPMNGYNGDYNGRGYDEGGYNARGYSENGYNAGGYNNEYSRQYMNSGNGGGRGYNGYDPRMRDHMNRIIEGAEQYEYGRDRYMHGGGSSERMTDGLEKLMYAICMFVESTMEFAQSPQEKEIIRKHLHKMKNL